MNGQLRTIIDPDGLVFTYEYNQNGQLSKIIKPDLTEIIYLYDANGNLISLTPPGKPIHSFEYNGLDNELKYKPPVTNIINPDSSFEYNLDNQLTKVIRADGQEINLSYNIVSGKLDSTQTPLGFYNYSYNLSTGRLNHIASPDGVEINYTHDGFLPISTIWSGGIIGSVLRVYDDNFRVVSRTINNTNTINYSYDNDNLIILAGALSISRELQKRGLINGTSLLNVTTTNTYSDFKELSLFNAKHNGIDIYNVLYTSDKIGRVKSEMITINSNSIEYEFDYDTADRLIEVKTNGVVNCTWSYDSNGNRTHINGKLVAVYDDQDRLLNYDGTFYSYNDHGDLISKIKGTDTFTYQYDVYGNLKQVINPDATTIEYIVDGKNRRVAKLINGVKVNTWLYKDGLNPIAELDNAGNIVSRYIYGDKGNIPSYMIKSGITYRIISDGLGSPILIIDALTGIIAQEMSYDVWGNVLTDSNPGFQPFGFAGGLYDNDTKLTRFGYRDYDATIGRWTVKDPIRFAGGDENLYVYASNDPINSYDLTGLQRGGPVPILRNNFDPALNNRNTFRNQLNNSTITPRPIPIKPRTNELNESYIKLTGKFVKNPCNLFGQTCGQYQQICVAWACDGKPKQIPLDFSLIPKTCDIYDKSFIYGDHSDDTPIMTGPEGLDLRANGCTCIAVKLL